MRLGLTVDRYSYKLAQVTTLYVLPLQESKWTEAAGP